MKLLITSFFQLALLVIATAQNPVSEKDSFYCAPCGCSYDDKLLPLGGKCPECKMRLLKKGTYNFHSVSLANDGSMVYVSNEQGNRNHVYYKQKIHSRGRLIGEGGSPKISGDGKFIVFGRNDSDLYVYNIRKGTLIDVGTQIKLSGIQTPAWSIHGNEIIFSAGVFPDIAIYTLNMKSMEVKHIVGKQGMRYGAVASPDGKQLAYRMNVGTSKENVQRGLAIYDVATGKEKFITSIGEYGNWSPDGKKLAFHWQDSGFCIYTVNADGTDLKKIAGAKGSDFELPCWSPDGSRIYYQTNKRQGNWEIWRMRADGTQHEPLLY